jgi:hypothetical protein
MSKNLFEFMKLSVLDDLSHQHNRLVGLITTNLVSFGYSTFMGTKYNIGMWAWTFLLDQ